MRAAVFGALLACGACTCARPAAPPSLKQAIADVEARVAESPPGAFGAVKHLADQLGAFAQQKGVPEGMKQDLQKLSAEALDFAAQGLMAPAPRDEWNGLRARVERVLEGKPAGPGPRFRRDVPLPVRDAVAGAEAAFQSYDLNAACAAIDQVTMELSQWRWRDPPPPSVDNVRGALELLDAMPEGCREQGLAEAREKFGRAMAMLAPAP